MQFSHAFIEVVKDSANIVEVIQQFVKTPFKRSGGSYLTLCPFHGEKTPSFSISQEKKIFKCFGCGVGGDVFAFLSKHEGISFPDAVKWIATKYGISLEEIQRGSSVIEPRGRDGELLNFVSHLYAELLLGSEEPLNYLTDIRGIERDIIDSFGVGFAPNDWTTVKSASESQGFTEQDLTRVGLLATSQGRRFDWFRGRIMFPLTSPTGHIIGFTGRAVEKSITPKYLNSPETEFFTKSRQMFGFPITSDVESTLPEGTAIVVEGNMDVMTFFQEGIMPVVSPCGTNFSREQAAILGSKFRELWVCPDGDDAGLKASLMMMPIVFSAGMYIKFLSLPKDMDPDEYVITYGSSGLSSLISDSISPISYLLRHRHYLEDIQKFVEQIISSTVDPFMRELLLKELRDGDSSLYASVRGEGIPSKSQVFPTSAATVITSISPVQTLERMVVASMMEKKDFAESGILLLEEGDFRDPVAFEAFISVKSFLKGETSDLSINTGRVLGQVETISRAKEFFSSIGHLKSRSISAQSSVLRDNLGDDDLAQLDRLQVMKSSEIDYRREEYVH